MLSHCASLYRIVQGKCLYYREWNRPQNTLENADDDGEEQRLMFGMLYSLKVGRQAQKARYVYGSMNSYDTATLAISTGENMPCLVSDCASNHRASLCQSSGWSRGVRVPVEGLV